MSPFLRSAAPPLSLFVLTPFVLGACGGAGAEKASTTQPAAEQQPRTAAHTTANGHTPRPRARTSDDTRGAGRSSPSIAIRRPRIGQIVNGHAVTVSVSVEHFRIVEQRTRPPFPPPVAGRGHVHFYLDTETLPTTHGPPASGAYRSIAGMSYTWTGVARGKHSFAVQLVGKDHAPLSPPVKDRVTVVVE
jgi:hypothetical protein